MMVNSLRRPSAHDSRGREEERPRRCKMNRWGLPLLSVAACSMLVGACNLPTTAAQSPTSAASSTASTDPCVDPAASVQACADSLGGSNTTSTDTTSTETTPVDTTMRIYYTVKSAAGVDTITYNDGNGNIQQDTTGKWSRWVSKTYAIPGDGSFFASVSGQNQGGGKIVCDVYRWSSSRHRWVVAN